MRGHTNFNWVALLYISYTVMLCIIQYYFSSNIPFIFLFYSVVNILKANSALTRWTIEAIGLSFWSKERRGTASTNISIIFEGGELLLYCYAEP